MSIFTVREGEFFNFENRHYYDVTELKRMVNNSPGDYPAQKTALDDSLMYHISMYEDLNQDWVRDMPKALSEEPILVVGIGNGQSRIIDGHHRIHRLHRAGRKDIKVVAIPEKIADKHKVPPEEAKKIIASVKSS